MIALLFNVLFPILTKLIAARGVNDPSGRGGPRNMGERKEQDRPREGGWRGPSGPRGPRVGSNMGSRGAPTGGNSAAPGSSAARQQRCIASAYYCYILPFVQGTFEV